MVAEKKTSVGRLPIIKLVWLQFDLLQYQLNAKRELVCYHHLREDPVPKIGKWIGQHPSMGGKSRRSRRSGTRGEVTTCGGPAPGWPPPTPHTWLPPTTGFPPAHSHKGVSPHSSLSSSKFRQRKSRRGVAPSLWCPNWHPA